MEVDDSEKFLDTDALPHVHCVGTTVEQVEVCYLSKRVDLGLHHESNTSKHFNCSELSTSSDCFYGAVVCSRDTAYATPWFRVIAYTSVR